MTKQNWMEPAPNKKTPFMAFKHFRGEYSPLQRRKSEAIKKMWRKKSGDISRNN